MLAACSPLGIPPQAKILLAPATICRSHALAQTGSTVRYDFAINGDGTNRSYAFFDYRDAAAADKAVEALRIW